MRYRYADVKGHPNLKKDLISGAVISVNSSNSKSRKQALREKNKNMETRIAQLEKLVYELCERDKING